MNPARKFGLKPAIPAKVKRLLKFDDYLGLAVPAPPSRVDWTKGFAIDYGMALNDTLGCCVEAAKLHAIQTMTLDNGRMDTLPDSAVLSAYEQTGGYVPGDPSTDGGEDMITSLNAWRKGGFGGIALDSYTAVDPTNQLHVQQAIYLFGLVDIGFNVPQSAMDQNQAGQTWDVVPDDGGIVGGHSVVVPMYDSKVGMFTCITWGMRQPMTLAFWQKYVSEVYGLLCPVWLNEKGLDPSGFNQAALAADLAQVTS